MTSRPTGRADAVADRPAPTGARADQRAVRGGWVPVLLLALGYLLWQLLLAPAAAWYPDTARYAADAWEWQGVPAVDAEQRAAGLLCADRAEQAERRYAAQTLPAFDPPDVAAAETACRDALAVHLEPTDDPRYVAIFDTRQGYPLAVSVLEPVLGMTPALWAVATGATLVAGLAVAALLVAAGTTRRVAAAGQLVVYAGPAGWWGAQLLTEGLVLGGIAVAWCGWVWCARGRLPGGALLLAGGLGVAASAKYSTVLPVAVGLTLAAALSLRHAHRWGLVLAAAIGATTAATILVLSQWLGWPDWRDTAQDLFTEHYATPDVPGVAGRLLAANLAYWARWPVLTPANAALVAGLLVGGWALWRWWPPLALSAGALVVAAVALTAAHPDVIEGDRLYVLAWVAAAVGIAVATTSRRPETGGSGGVDP